MSVIVRLQNLPWAANAVDIRQYFHGLSIPEGGVHIVGGELGDAFIAFSTDEDARQAMLRDGGKVKDITIKLYLSSRAEMQKIIDQARQQSLGMQQFMSMPAMAPIPVPVPVTSITVPNIPVPSVSIPSVQNVPAMQVPLQNVAAMVTNMAKPDTSTIAQPVTAIGDIQEQNDNKPAFSSNQSVKSETDKDKKDKRRRRTRSHSRESSNSRSDSRSRSRSRSSSRSRDRKGRDRHHDRRRKRSRSRDRRRRRDRSRSRDRLEEMRDRRSYNKDRRKDHSRHGSREEFDDNSQSRWSNPAQRSRQNRQRPDFYNRNSQNQHRGHYQQKPNAPKGGSNADPTRHSFLDDETSQTSIPSEPKAALPSPLPKENNTNTHSPMPTVSNSGPALPTSSSAPLVSQNTPNLQTSAVISQNMSSNNQNYFATLPPPPMFNPQNLVTYPNYNPNGLPAFNTFPPLPPHQTNPGNVQQDMSRKPENDGQPDFIGSESRNSPLIKSSGTEHMLNAQNKLKSDLPQERGMSKFGNESMSGDIPLPNNDKILQSSGGPTGWGYDDSNYLYNEETKSGSNMMEQYSSGWNKSSNTSSNTSIKPVSANSFDKKHTNTCVQMKNVPDHTKHEDIRGFFRNNHISAGCLKIVRNDNGRVSGVFVKFDNLSDKKKAICRSGCLLNNSIVTIFHVDDNEFNDAVDVMDINPPYWNSGNENMDKDDIAEASEMMDVENESEYNCVKFQGSMRFHPFYNAKNRVHPHIRSLCDKFNLVDVCVVQTRPLNSIDAFMKFENNSVAEAAVDFLNDVKVDGKSVVVSTCSSEEYLQAKSNSIPMDVQHFLRAARSQPPAFSKPNVKQEDRADPRLQSSTYSDRRTKSNDHHEDDMFDSDMDMKADESELEPDFKKNNKVLLPTPSPMLQLPLQKDIYMLNTNCVLMQNLPLQANDRDILDFFSDAGVVPTQIHIMLDSNGKQYGDAFCEFEKNDEAVNASKKNNFLMNKNNIYVRLVSRQEMSNALGVSVLTSGPNSMGGPPQGGPFFSGPPGMFGGNVRMEFPRMGGSNDWMPSFNPGGGPMGQNSSNYSSQSDRGYRPGGRGGHRGRGDGDFGGRGGRGSRGIGDRGGRGRGEMGGRGGRGGDMGGRGGRGIDGGMRGSRGGEGGRGMSSRGGLSRGSMRGGIDGIGRGGRGGGDIGRGGRGGSDMGRGRGSRGSIRGGISRGGRDMNEFPRNHPPDLMSLPGAPLMEQKQSGGPPPLIQSSASVTRPIQLEEDSVREFGQPGCVVSAENVPYRADLNDILDFFGEYDVTAESIIRRYNDAGQVTGDARIAFKTPGDAKKAIKYLNKKSIGGRRVNLTLFK